MFTNYDLFSKEIAPKEKKRVCRTRKKTAWAKKKWKKWKKQKFCKKVMWISSYQTNDINEKSPLAHKLIVSGFIGLGSIAMQFLLYAFSSCVRLMVVYWIYYILKRRIKKRQKICMFKNKCSDEWIQSVFRFRFVFIFARLLIPHMLALSFCRLNFSSRSYLIL